MPVSSDATSARVFWADDTVAYPQDAMPNRLPGHEAFTGPSIPGFWAVVGRAGSTIVPTGGYRPGWREDRAVRRGQPSWYADALSAILRMEHLAENWDSYGAEPPNALSRDLATRGLDALARLDLRPDYVTPSVENGITFSVLREPRSAAVEFLNTGEVIAVVSERGREPTAWEITADDPGIYAALAEIQEALSG